MLEFTKLVLCAAALASLSRAQGDLLVTSRFTDEVLRYDASTGAFEGVFASGGGLDNPVGLTFGPDGNLYVASGDNDQVLRYDGTSGAFLGVFASGGGLAAPRQVNFGPDGELYVASGATNAILRYDGVDGTFLGVFASGGALNGPTSFTFGPDGDLYVGSVITDKLKRFDGTTGAYLGNFVKTDLNGPHDLAFGPDGLLYVTNAFNKRVQRFDGATGVFVDTFIQDPAFSAALGMCWDELGRLYIANQGTNEVRRYDGRTGAYLDSPVASGSGGLSGPLFATFTPWPRLRALAPTPASSGTPNWFAIGGATPGALLTLTGSAQPSLLAPACSHGIPLGVPELSIGLVADESGRALRLWTPPATSANSRFFARALEPAACRSSGIVSAVLD
ncbi:MAG: NHL repeat-containing protein [Planctomycetes bacterium]|nr:NHL repeat-containing protein [Planctomycetota bacterium]